MPETPRVTKRNTVRGITLLALAVCMLATTACSSLSFAPSPAEKAKTARETAEKEWRYSGSVVSAEVATPVIVLDGDSMVFQLADGTQKEVRLIGIDAPELGYQADLYGTASRDAAAQFLRSVKHVYIEVGAQAQDKYGKTLAYVWLAKPSARPSASEVRAAMLNAKMAIAGYAKYREGDPNVVYLNTKYSKLFAAYSQEARASNQGLWDPTFADGAEPNGSWASEATESAPPITSPFVGNSATHFFHRATCPNALEMKTSHRVAFETRSEAIKAGYRACGLCKP